MSLKKMSRRDFIRSSAAGTAVLTFPAFLSGCGGTTVRPDDVPIESSFMNWFGVDEGTIRTVLSELTSYGADTAELYFEHGRTNSITYEDGIISAARSSVSQGVGLRAVVGDQTGYAYTEELTREAMLGAARIAASIAHGTQAVAPQAFSVAEPERYYTVTVPWSDVGIEQKLPLIERIATLARAEDPAVEKVLIWWTDEEQQILIATLDGRIITDARPMARVYVTVTATKDGETLSNSANIAGRRGIDWYTEEQLALVARQAVERTMVLFDARRPPAGEMPVVLAAGASGILLHEAIGHGMEADFNRKNISIYSDLLGEAVAEDFVTIVDNGTQPYERGALNVDDEGQPCERTVLVENGRLVSYLHDSISARHYGVESTGSGRRESFRHAPMPRMRSTYMEDGPHTRDDIIASVQNGIMAETFTNGQVQIGAGDYTFYIKNGWLIENGRLTAPIKDTNIIGTGPETLRNITMVANDGRLDTGGWTCGKNGQAVPVSQGLPTVLVSSLTVGGENA